MNRVVHFEVPAGDLDRAKKFYSNVFGWQIMDMPEMSYVIVTTTDSDEKGPKNPGAINGGMMKRGSIKNPVITIEVPDIDSHLKKIEEAGGKVVAPKIAVGDMGFSAYIMDTEGNVMGLWQNAM